MPPSISGSVGRRADGNWSASAWVTNLTDEDVPTGLAPTFNLPRTYGAKIGYGF